MKMSSKLVCDIWPSVLCSGCWTISSEKKKRIRAIEMWFNRSMLKIQWFGVFLLLDNRNSSISLLFINSLFIDFWSFFSSFSVLSCFVLCLYFLLSFLIYFSFCFSSISLLLISGFFSLTISRQILQYLLSRFLSLITFIVYIYIDGIIISLLY